MLRIATFLGLVCFVLSLVGCGSGVGNDGAIVGGDCVVSSECAMESRCLTGVDFPGGYCAKSCTVDEDCPGGSSCVAELGGTCMVECGSAAQCRNLEGYDCVSLPAQDGTGPLDVCATP